MSETENQTRLRRANEALGACQERENEARRTLADAVASTKRAREKRDELFLIEEQQEAARRRAAYNHCTK